MRPKLQKEHITTGFLGIFYQILELENRIYSEAYIDIYFDLISCSTKSEWPACG